MTDLDVWPAELAERYREDDLQVIAGKVEKNVEEPYVLGQGLGWIETFKKPVISPDGKVLGTVGYARGITSRRQLERQLAENEGALGTRYFRGERSNLGLESGGPTPFIFLIAGS